MTDQEAKIKDLELRVKKLEDKVFDTWLDQYEPKVNFTQEAQDEWYVGLTAPENSKKNEWINVPPEEVLYPDVTTKPFDWNEVPDNFSVCKPHSDEYIGGPVAGYCPDYMKETK